LNRYQIIMSSRMPHIEHLEQLAEMLVHVGRSARAEGREDMLTAAQWTALRFFARANRASRTPSAFASFQATTRGTASQVIKSLVQGGFLERHASDTDKRSVRFEVTGQGRDILARDPLRHLVSALAGLSDADHATLSRALPDIASNLARHRGDRGFGTCGDCRYFEDRDGAAYCACVASDLAPFEIGQLCANFSTTSTNTEPTGSKP
jgi:DNA-binding MarR family transcriptional regulator